MPPAVSSYYDVARGRSVFFRGTTSFEWDGSDLIRTSRWGGGVYDIARQRQVVLDVNGTTREFDGVHWFIRNPSVHPPSRTRYAATYDLARRQTLLFGGADDSNWPGPTTQLSDTWSWDGESWTQHATPVHPPEGVVLMTYDILRQRVFAIGGDRTMWEWDGATWTNLPGQAPAVKTLEYSLSRQRVVALVQLGGANQNRLWEWDGSTWNPVLTANQPPEQSMVYDLWRDRLVMNDGGAIWEFDNVDWLRRTPELMPSFSWGQLVAYDATRGKVVAAYHGTVTEWDGFGWSYPGPSAAVYGVGMAFDAVRQRTVVLTFQGETWEWDGVAWVQRFPSSSPPMREAPCMVWDAHRSRVVLFGGLGLDGLNLDVTLDDTWEWDGTNWTQIFPTTRPPARWEAVCAFDPVRNRVVIASGHDGPNVFQDTWEWDGVNWVLRWQGNGPAHEGTMAWNPARQRMLFIGGQVVGGGGPYGGNFVSAWEWDGSSWVLTQGTFPEFAGGGMVYDAARGRMLFIGGVQAVFTPNPPWGPDVWVVTANSDTWLSGADIAAVPGQDVGTACSLRATPPALRESIPRIGERASVVDVYFAPPNATCHLAFATAPASSPAGGGCVLYIDDPFLILQVVANPFGFASLKLTIPIDPALRGVSVWTQAAVEDPLGPTPGFAFTGGRVFQIGE